MKRQKMGYRLRMKLAKHRAWERVIAKREAEKNA